MSAILDNNNHTTDNNNKIRDLSMNSASHSTMPTTTTKKRSFDVAFLMQPDEKLLQSKVDYNLGPRKIFHPETSNISIKADALLRQLGSPNSSVIDDTSSVDRNSTDSPTNEEIDIMTNGNSNSSYGSANPIDTASIQESVRYFRTQVSRNINSGSTLSPRIFSANNSPGLSDLEVHRSAFTKVPRLDSPPGPPLSPDRLSCSSISPPVVSRTPPRPFVNFRSEYGFTAQFPVFLQQAHQQPPPSSVHHYPGPHPGAMNSQVSLVDGKSSPMKQQYFYRPPNHDQLRAQNDGYPPFHMTTPPTSPAMHHFSNDLSGIARHPAAAAAILSTLIPPTIASSFSLAAQNVCAKCNISFRMTSDLVYHMRSHHKSENINENHRRKREDKLKCPVCNESFRERHHLTRHMTAHQDKASDDAEPPATAAAQSRNNHQILAQEFIGSKGRHNGLLQMNHQQNHHHHQQQHGKGQ